MNRSTVAALVLPLGLLPVGAVAAPSYAVDTCHGLPVTIQGTANANLQGTAGDDVIVTNGAQSVIAGAGNDTICVVDGGRYTTVLAQSGDDYVQVLDDSYVQAYLGLGSDTYRGGTDGDYVSAAGAANLGGDTSVDTETDDIETGAGADTVLSGLDGQPNNDRLVLGDGYDAAQISGTTGTVDAGPAPNLLDVTTDPTDTAASWEINDVTGVVSRLGVPMWHATGFTDVRLGHFALGADITVQGTGADEEFDLFDRPGGGSVSIYGAGGDDEVTARETHDVHFRGGGGRDEIKLIGTFGGTLKARGSAEFRMSRGRARIVAHGARQSWTYDNVEVLKVFGFGAITVIGTGRDERLLAGDACHVTIRGIGGDDVLTRRRAEECGKHGQTTLVDGGPGNDTLIGSQGNDVLLGGRGRDRADGRSGVDRCVAEKEKGCER